MAEITKIVCDICGAEIDPKKEQYIRAFSDGAFWLKSLPHHEFCISCYNQMFSAAKGESE